MRTVVGLFETRDQAERAVSALRNSGFMAEDISIVMRDRAEAQRMATDVGAGDATAAGVVGGGLLGGLAGLLVGIGALAIPGLGPLIAAGPLAATLAGGAVGAVTGGLLGALVDAGVPEEEARYYQTGVERGGILLSVRVPDNREMEARRILQQAGMRDMEYHRGLWEKNPDYEYDPYKAENADKTLGGTLAGGVAGAAIGTAVGGPVGTVVGGAIGGATGAAAGAAVDWSEAEPSFREDWSSSRYSNRPFEQVAPSYRYGWDAYSRPEYQNMTFDQVRNDLRQNWRGQGTWEDNETLVQAGWEKHRTWKNQPHTAKVTDATHPTRQR